MYPLALARMASRTRGEEFLFAKFAAAQRERSGFYRLGRCYESGNGCEQDFDKARECHLIAAQLGEVASMRNLGDLSNESDPQRWFWWGRAAVLGRPDWFLSNFSLPVRLFNSGSENGTIVFQIGKVLNGHVERRTIFSSINKFVQLIGPANSAISFYKAQLSACRRAVDTWSHVGIRCNVVKDIRVLIGKLVWEARDLALYKA
jgi:TPR repeat protein